MMKQMSVRSKKYGKLAECCSILLFAGNKWIQLCQSCTSYAFLSSWVPSNWHHCLGNCVKNIDQLWQEKNKKQKNLLCYKRLRNRLWNDTERDINGDWCDQNTEFVSVHSSTMKTSLSIHCYLNWFLCCHPV